MSTTYQDLAFTIFVNSAVYFSDLINRGVIDVNGNGFMRAPQEAAGGVAADLRALGTWTDPGPLPLQQDPDDAFTSPSVRSRWFAKNLYYADDQFPLDLATFKRKSGGWFGISWLFGDETIYTWVPHYEFSPPPDANNPGNPNPELIFTPRRWIDGAEDGWPNGVITARVASRHMGGFGYVFDRTRGTVVHQHMENRGTPPGSATPTSPAAWERFYIKVIQWPTKPVRIWRCTSTQGQYGPVLALGAGSLLWYAGAPGSAAPSGAWQGLLALNTWYRIDMHYDYFWQHLDPPYPPNPIGGFECIGYVNGVVALEKKFSTVFAPAAIQAVVSSELGGGLAADTGTPPDGIFFIDDWVCGDFPLVDMEIGYGSKIALIGAMGFDGSSSGAWAGDWRLTRQRPGIGGNANASFLTSSTPGALLAVTTDVAVEINAQANLIGIAAQNLAVFSSKSGSGANGTLDGVAVPETATLTWYHVLRNMAVKALDETLLLQYSKGNSTDVGKVQALLASVEMMGTFGKEDVSPTPTGAVPATVPQPFRGIHNAPYPHSPWALDLTPPESPVVIKTGQYTGNGTGQDLRFRTPVHLFWVRGVSGGTGAQWWSSMIAPHLNGQGGCSPDTFIQCLIDPTFVVGDATETNMDLPPAPDNMEQAIAESNLLAYGFTKNDDSYAPWHNYLQDPDYYWKRMLGWEAEGGPDEAVAGLYAVPPSPWLSTQQQQTLIRLGGGNAGSNQAGVTYSYLAFCDPGMRFCYADELPAVNSTLDVTVPLYDYNFLAETAFVQSEYDIQSSSTPALLFKGLGSAAAAVTRLLFGEIVSALQFGLGTATYKQPIQQSLLPGSIQSYLAFRHDDGSGDPGVVRVLQLGTYVGNGATTRTIALTPPSGRRPMWAIIVGHGNGVAMIRDPYHTGPNCTQWPTVINNSGTGITGGGIDQINIGSAINQNGVVYDLLVFPGPDCVGNNGWGCAGEVIPVTPTAPGPGPTPNPNPPPGVPPPWNPPGPDTPPQPPGPTTPPEVPPGGPASYCVTDFPLDPT